MPASSFCCQSAVTAGPSLLPAACTTCVAGAAVTVGAATDGPPCPALVACSGVLRHFITWLQRSELDLGKTPSLASGRNTSCSQWYPLTSRRHVVSAPPSDGVLKQQVERGKFTVRAWYTLSYCYTVTLTQYPTVTQSPHHTVTLSHRRPFALSYCRTATLPHRYTDSLSYRQTIALSNCQTATLSHSHTFTLSHCHLSYCQTFTPSARNIVRLSQCHAVL